MTTEPTMRPTDRIAAAFAATEGTEPPTARQRLAATYSPADDALRLTLQAAADRGEPLSPGQRITLGHFQAQRAAAQAEAAPPEPTPTPTPEPEPTAPTTDEEPPA